MLTLERLSTGYRSRRDETVVASDISLELRGGELVCLLGPNGAGKSTLMRTVAGMQPALGGRVLVDGDDVHLMPARERARRLGVVLTGRVEAGLLTAYALVGLGRYPHTNWSGKLSGHDHKVIRECIDRVRGAFQVHRHFVGEVELVGDGLVRYWTARTLEREGVHVWDGEGRAPPIRVVVPGGEGGEWSVSGGSGAALPFPTRGSTTSRRNSAPDSSWWSCEHPARAAGAVRGPVAEAVGHPLFTENEKSLSLRSSHAAPAAPVRGVTAPTVRMKSRSKQTVVSRQT